MGDILSGRYIIQVSEEPSGHLIWGAVMVRAVMVRAPMCIGYEGDI